MGSLSPSEVSKVAQLFIVKKETKNGKKNGGGYGLRLVSLEVSEHDLSAALQKVGNIHPLD